MKGFEEGWESLFDYLHTASNKQIRGVMVDRKGSTDQYINAPNIAFPVLTDEEVVKTIRRGKIENLDKKEEGEVKKRRERVRRFEGFLYTQLLDLQYYFNDNRKEENGDYANEKEFFDVCKKVNENIATIVKCLPSNSLVVITTGQANIRYFSEFVFHCYNLIQLFSLFSNTKTNSAQSRSNPNLNSNSNSNLSSSNNLSSNSNNNLHKAVDNNLERRIMKARKGISFFKIT